MRALIGVLVAACGSQPHPPSPPPFDAPGLAARLDRVMADMEATVALRADCPHMLEELGRIELRARGPIDEARAAERVPEQARQLAAALARYQRTAAGRSDAIAMALAICWKSHDELRDQVQHVVDSMPTL